MIEREFDVGGVCLPTGTILSKTFREAVLSLTVRSNPFHTRRKNDKQRLKPTAKELFARVDDLIGRETHVQEDQLRRNDVEIINGAGEFQDAHTVIAKGASGDRLIRADNILVAVGTHPTPPDSLSVSDPAVITSDDVPRLNKLPRSMVVIGCGVVGIEYVSMFAALGVEVTMVDGRRRPLEFLDDEIIDEFMHQMRDMRVIFRLGKTVERLETIENGRRHIVVHLQSGKRIATDLAFICAGRIGATASLKLDSAGLSADERGRLSVNEEFRTNTSNIFAARDVIGIPSLAATSAEQGRLAACKAFGIDSGPMPDNFPVGIYAIPEISMVGKTERTLTEGKNPV